MDKSDFLDEIKKFETKGEISITIESPDDEQSYILGKDIIRIIKPNEEIAKRKIVERNKEIFERTYISSGDISNILIKLFMNLKGCLKIKITNSNIRICPIECPSCEPGSFTNLPEKFFLLDNGRIVEKISDNEYNLYLCRLSKPG